MYSTCVGQVSAKLCSLVDMNGYEFQVFCSSSCFCRLKMELTEWIGLIKLLGLLRPF